MQEEVVEIEEEVLEIEEVNGDFVGIEEEVKEEDVEVEKKVVWN